MSGIVACITALVVEYEKSINDIVVLVHKEKIVRGLLVGATS